MTHVYWSPMPSRSAHAKIDPWWMHVWLRSAAYLSLFDLQKETIMQDLSLPWNVSTVETSKPEWSRSSFFRRTLCALNGEITPISSGRMPSCRRESTMLATTAPSTGFCADEPEPSSNAGIGSESKNMTFLIGSNAWTPTHHKNDWRRNSQESCRSIETRKCDRKRQWTLTSLPFWNSLRTE